MTVTLGDSQSQSDTEGAEVMTGGTDDAGLVLVRKVDLADSRTDNASNVLVVADGAGAVDEAWAEACSDVELLVDDAVEDALA